MNIPFRRPGLLAVGWLCLSLMARSNADVSSFTEQGEPRQTARADNRRVLATRPRVLRALIGREQIIAFLIARDGSYRR